MKQNTYFMFTAVIFLIVALLHLLRILNGWEASIGGWLVPVWCSWVGAVVAGFLAYFGFKHNRAE